MNNAKNDKITLFICALLCCLLWGSAFPFVKLGYSLFNISESQYDSQILFAGIRFTLAGVLVIIFASVAQRKLLLPSKASIVKIPILSMFQTVFQYIFFYIGLANASGTSSSIINSTSVFFAVIISALIFRNDKITFRKAIGCIIGFAGCVIVNSGNGGIDRVFSINGEGFILISSFSYAVSTILLKKFSEKDSPVALSGYQFMLGGIIMTVIGILLGGRLNTLTINGVILLIYLALVSSVAYTLWGLLLRKHNVSTVATFGFMTPIFGCILSAIFLNEPIKDNFFKIALALIFVSAGIVLVNNNGRRRQNES